jgi:hypothetical protein
VVALELSGGRAAWNLHWKATVGALAQGGRAKFAGKRVEGVAHWRHRRAEEQRRQWSSGGGGGGELVRRGG